MDKDDILLININTEIANDILAHADNIKIGCLDWNAIDLQSLSKLPKIIVIDTTAPLQLFFTLLAETTHHENNSIILILSADRNVNSLITSLTKTKVLFLNKHDNTKQIALRILNYAQKNLFSDKHSYEFDLMINLPFQSEKMKQVKERINIAAKSTCNVLLYGEPGTIRDIYSFFIHINSPLKDKPHTYFSCTSVQEEDLCKALFGKTPDFKGSTKSHRGIFEQNPTGTICLSEIETLPHSVQSSLRNCLDSRSFYRINGVENLNFNARIISSSNKNMHTLNNPEEFRQDLFYLLSVINIYFPSLREIKEDIIPISEYLLKYYSKKNDKIFDVFDQSSKFLLCNYHWPGNLRELNSVIENIATVFPGGVVNSDYLPDYIKLPDMRRDYGETLYEKLQCLEKDEIRMALLKFKGNRNKAASHLGMSLRNLQIKLKKYNITD
ncbi:MAG: sigma 54-interacting transcriptional regulator [Bacillota bacterium]